MSDILNEFLNEEETKQQAACIYSLLMGDFRPEFLSPSAKRVKSVFDPSNPNSLSSCMATGTTLTAVCASGCTPAKKRTGMWRNSGAPRCKCVSIWAV